MVCLWHPVLSLLYIFFLSLSHSLSVRCSSVVANQLSPGIVPRAPIARPLLNAGVVGQDSILNAFYNGKRDVYVLYELWSCVFVFCLILFFVFVFGFAVRPGK